MVDQMIKIGRMDMAKQSSEFGGDPGTIQPPPHELTNIETARLERRTNSADPNDSVEQAREREVKGK